MAEAASAHQGVLWHNGTSENAVKIQIYAAIITYCLVVIVQKEMKLEKDTYDVLRIFEHHTAHKDAATRLAQQQIFTGAGYREARPT